MMEEGVGFTGELRPDGLVDIKGGGSRGGCTLEGCVRSEGPVGNGRRGNAGGIAGFWAHGFL